MSTSRFRYDLKAPKVLIEGSDMGVQPFIVTEANGDLCLQLGNDASIDSVTASLVFGVVYILGRSDPVVIDAISFDSLGIDDQSSDSEIVAAITGMLKFQRTFARPSAADHYRRTGRAC